MSDLIRYTETFSGMEPDDIGDWVKFKDAKALQEEVIRLYKEVGKAKSDLLINTADNNDTISTLTQRLAEDERLLDISQCPNSCTAGFYYAGSDDLVHCQFCYERKQALSNSEGGSDDA